MGFDLGQLVEVAGLAEDGFPDSWSVALVVELINGKLKCNVQYTEVSGARSTAHSGAFTVATAWRPAAHPPRWSNPAACARTSISRAVHCALGTPAVCA